MKEYHIEFVKQGVSVSSQTKKIENLLNQMAEQGWDFNSYSSPYWIFEREK